MINIRMMRAIIFSLLILLISNSLTFSQTGININIKTILASQKKTAKDPRISNFTQQFQPVFKYSSYELFKQEDILLDDNSENMVTLPGDMIMKIVSKGITGNRISLELEIFRKERQIFKTLIQLRNDSSVTIGGPEYKKGSLLFNIYASF